MSMWGRAERRQQNYGVHRWRVERQPWPWRLGCDHRHARRARHGARRRSRPDDEQQDGAHRRHRGALEHLQGTRGPVSIYTDSTYVIQGIGGWVHGWKRRGWKTAAGTDVLNRGLWEQLDALTSARGPRSLTWHYVRGHVGIPGNERVDRDRRLVRRAEARRVVRRPAVRLSRADSRSPRRHHCPCAEKPSAGASRSRGPAYSYLSVVDGKPMRHATWSECEGAREGPLRRTVQESDERGRPGGDPPSPGA